MIDEMHVKQVVCEQLTVIDQAGRPRAIVAHYDEPPGGTGVMLLDDQGQCRASIGLDQSGDPSIILRSPGGERETIFLITSRGVAVVGRDQSGNHWTATIDENGIRPTQSES